MDNNVRLLDSSDSESFKELRLKSLKNDPESWHSSIEEEGSLPLSAFASKITIAIYSPIYGYYGYFEKNKIMAYAQLANSTYKKKKHIVTLYDVVVSEQARRKSIGTKLITSIIAKAKSLSEAEQVHLKVNSRNKGAIAFYEKLGFKKEATLKNAVKEHDGTYQDEFEYVLLI